MIENEYGKLYLSEERAKEYIDIVTKHHLAMMDELKEKGIIPSVVRLEKTTVWEYEDIKRIDEERQSKKLNNKSI